MTTNHQPHRPLKVDHLPEPEAPRRDLIPPHIAWPLFIVFLLSISVTAALYTAYMAHSDGGVQVVESSEYAPGK